MSEKVRKQVQTKIKVDTFLARHWWIGAEFKSGTWTWVHSKKPMTYVSKIGANHSWGHGSSYPYLYIYLSKKYGWMYYHTGNNCFYSLCQISQ